MTTRVLVVEDQDARGDKLSTALSSQGELEVVGTATNGEHAVRTAEELDATVAFRTSARPSASAAQRFTGGTGVGATIGCVFLLTVRGADLKLEGQLTKVVPVSAGPGRLGARVEITNTGNVHMFPEGQVELRDLDGNVIGIFELPETTAILPGETQSLYLQGVQDVQDADYRAFGTIEYGWNSEQTKPQRSTPRSGATRRTPRRSSSTRCPSCGWSRSGWKGPARMALRSSLPWRTTGTLRSLPRGSSTC